MEIPLYKMGRRALFSLALVGFLSLGGCVNSGKTGAPQAGGDGTGIQGIRRFASLYDPTAPLGRRGSIYRKLKPGIDLRGATVSVAYDYFYEDTATAGTFEPIAAADIKQVEVARTFYLVNGKLGVFEKERDPSPGGLSTESIVGACVFEDGDTDLGEPNFATAYIVYDTTLDTYIASMEASFKKHGNAISSEELPADFEVIPSAIAVGNAIRFTINGDTSHPGQIEFEATECRLSGSIPSKGKNYVDIGTLTVTNPANFSSPMAE